MGWGCHPDTLAIACAQSAARKAVGKNASESSLEYKKAYRDAYAKGAEASGFDSGLAEYLADLDSTIAYFEDGGTQEGLAAFFNQRDKRRSQAFGLRYFAKNADPRARWSTFKAKYSNPDEILAVQEAYDLLTEINNVTLADDTATDWWASMTAYRDVLASRLREDDE